MRMPRWINVMACEDHGAEVTLCIRWWHPGFWLALISRWWRMHED